MSNSSPDHIIKMGTILSTHFVENFTVKKDKFAQGNVLGKARI